MFKQFIKGLPFYKRLEKYITYWEPGHYYSSIPDQHAAIDFIDKVHKRNAVINGIKLNDEKQIALFESFVGYFKEFPFGNKSKVASHRFYNDNGYYGGSDALYLYAIMRKLQPGQVIEVGSGFSSALMLDVNDRFFNKKIELTFIEPYPERLLNLLTEEDKSIVKLIQEPLQAVNLDVFRALETNDILFIDSSHVAKTGSDLLYLFFEILPVLKSGVYIHFHDIFNNFEYYPSHFARKGFGWNEDYFLRAFLMHNPLYEVVLFSNYLDVRYKDKLLALYSEFPISEGAHIWIRKL